MKGPHIPARLAPSYEEFLRLANGLWLFGGALDLWGFQPSGSPETAPTDLGSLFASLAFDHIQVDPDSTEFSSGDAFYFGWYGDNRSPVRIISSSGAVERTVGPWLEVQNQWPSFDVFLEQEVDRLATLFDTEGLRLHPTTASVPLSDWARPDGGA
ncbi:MAG: hypothetical protein JRG76_18365 [Deltaproteobacteria bacterium]|nr:hypothetical protein [Deltaproteobacteria bacterium]